MMLTSASSLSAGSGLVLSRAAGARTLAAAGSAVLLRHRQQHVRGFRFGWWDDRVDSERRSEMRRRYRALRLMYSDAVSRKMLWEQLGAASADLPHPYRHHANHYRQPKRCFAFTRLRSSKHDPLFESPKEKPTGTRPSQHGENIERSAWGHFVFRDSDATANAKQDAWASQFDDFRNYISKRQMDFLYDTGFGASAEFSTASATSGPASATASATSAATRTSAFFASASDDTASDFVIDPITNRKVSKSSAKSTAEEGVDVAPADQSASATSAASQAAPSLDADVPPTQAELHAYKDVAVNEPPADTAGQQPKYEDLHEYKPVKYNEPDGKVPEAEPAHTPEELAQYRPISWNEPDGQPTEPPVEIGHEGYDPAEVQQYKPFQWNEPDGKQSSDPLAEHPDPSELAKYKPVHWNEPDGQPTTPPVEIGHHGYDPVEVQQYKAFMWNEPDGKPDEPIELGHHGYDQTEVQQYKAFRYNEPDGKPPIFTGELGHHGYDQAEVQQYKAFRYNEPDGKPPVFTGELGHEGYDQAEVQQYKAFRYNEPDGKPPVFTGELGHHGYDQAEVQRYQAFRHNEPDGKPPVFTGERGHEGYDPAEVASYGAFRYQEPDGKPAAVAESSTDGLKAYDEKSSDSAVSEELYANVLRRLHSLTHLDGEEAAQESGASGLSAGGSGPATKKPSKPASNGQDRDQLESSMAQIAAEHDAIDKLASVSLKSFASRARKELTYAERLQAHTDPYCTEPQGLETAYEEECGGATTWPPYVKVHKRVDRPVALEATDPAAPQSVSEPFVYKILAYDAAKQSISIAETASTVPDTASPLTPAEVLLRLSNPSEFLPHFEPLQSQGFEIVSGGGDVLVFRKVREPAEGEATTGLAASDEVAADAGSTSASSSQAVNPIDMTGKRYVPPSTANFVSPTGYVNLDLPPFDSSPTTTDLPSPPHAPTGDAQTTRFQSNIGVRREEPVFSGPKDSKAADAKPSVAKRMAVGATWVAGVSYVLGVVSEYLKGR